MGNRRLRQVWLPGLAAAALLGGLASCTSGGDGKDSGSSESHSTRGGHDMIGAPACKGGTYRWFNVSKRSVLTDFAKARQYEKGDVVSSRYSPEIVRYELSVRADGPALSNRAVIRSLSGHMKSLDGLVPADGLTGDGTGGDETTTAKDNGSYGESKAERAGRYVTGRGVDLVEADFRHTCDGGHSGATTSGHVLTWTQAAEMISFGCHNKADQSWSGAEREAARLGCRKGDPARA